MIILYGIYSIKYYQLFFKEHNFYIMSQNRQTSTTVILSNLLIISFQLNIASPNTPVQTQSKHTSPNTPVQTHQSKHTSPNTPVQTHQFKHTSPNTPVQTHQSKHTSPNTVQTHYNK